MIATRMRMRVAMRARVGGGAARAGAALLAGAGLLAGALVGPAAAPVAAQEFPADSVIQRIIDGRIEDRRSAGIVIGLLEADGDRRVLTAGTGGPGARALDDESILEIGSITKVFTTILLADMALAGEVSLDDPVSKYLPAGVTVPSRNGKEITLLHLATVNSGLPRMPGNFQPADRTNPFADYTVEQMYAYLSGLELTRDPGAEYEYSNLGMGLLGHALGRAAGTTYEALVRERITDPLGMDNTAVALSPWMRERLALGHSGGQVVSNWDIPTLAGAGALRSNVEDMLEFAEAQLEDDDDRLHRAMRMTHELRYPIREGVMSVGMGWHIAHGAEGDIIWHNGGTGGYRAFLGFDPAKDMAVVILTNSGGPGADDIGFHLLHPSRPLAPPPAPAKQRTAIDVAPEVLARYVGTYEVAEDFEIEVSLRDGALYAKATDQSEVALHAETPTFFFLREADIQLEFVVENGAVTAAVLHQAGSRMRAAKR